MNPTALLWAVVVLLLWWFGILPLILAIALLVLIAIVA